MRAADIPAVLEMAAALHGRYPDVCASLAPAVAAKAAGSAGGSKGGAGAFVWGLSCAGGSRAGRVMPQSLTPWPALVELPALCPHNHPIPLHPPLARHHTDDDKAAAARRQRGPLRLLPELIAAGICPDAAPFLQVIKSLVS
jgi:hypothetical protein